MNARTQRLRCAKDSTVFLEDGDCPIEPGAAVIGALGFLDKITITYLFMLVISSISGGMSRGITAQRSFDYPGNSDIPVRWESCQISLI
jgi:hypothetical protein